jgi:hypothetical protein
VNFQLTNPNVFQADAGDIRVTNLSPVSVRCPHCRQLGSFAVAAQNVAVSYNKAGILGPNRSVVQQMYASVRICPNTSCRGLIFVIEGQGRVLEIEPPELLDFDSDNLPPALLATLREAISCHSAGAYRAAAMMVRRLLEEICVLNNAHGSNLHQRLEALKTRIVLPQALFEALSELKALGNDAAHIEAKAYENIGKVEASDSIELAKEILKALYQLQGLLARLQSRKSAANSNP